MFNPVTLGKGDFQAGQNRLMLNCHYDLDCSVLGSVVIAMSVAFVFVSFSGKEENKEIL